MCACTALVTSPPTSPKRASPGSWSRAIPSSPSTTCAALSTTAHLKCEQQRKCDLMSRMRVTIMLADAAQECGGKLFILGGGWSVTGPLIPPMAVALKIDVPWDQANRPHHWRLELVTEDGEPVELEGQP